MGKGMSLPLAQEMPLNPVVGVSYLWTLNLMLQIEFCFFSSYNSFDMVLISVCEAFQNDSDNTVVLGCFEEIKIV